MAEHVAVPNNVIHSPANRSALYVGAAIKIATRDALAEGPTAPGELFTGKREG